MNTLPCGLIELLIVVSLIGTCAQAASQSHFRFKRDATSDLFEAFKNKDEARVQILIENGANLNVKDDEGRLPIHLASLQGWMKIVEQLIIKGPPINAKTNRLETPLYLAADYGHIGVVKLLIENGSKINYGDINKWTPLHIASFRGYENIVELMLKKGVNPHPKNKEQMTPRDLAVLNGFGSIVDVIDRYTKIYTIQKACRRYTTDEITEYILNGSVAKAREFPWMVALVYLDASSNINQYRCGGTLISEDFILTAGHCVAEDDQPIAVRLGGLNLNDPGSKSYLIKDIIRHPKYSSKFKKNDIALIRLRGKIAFTPDKRPACLETDLMDFDSNVNLTISGWGSISAESFSITNRLMKAQVVTMPLAQCNQKYFEYFDDILPSSLVNGIDESQYCAHDPIGRSDSCKGDSGGPLQVFHDAQTSHVVAIVSFGVNCGTLPTIHTRVAYYAEWIQSHVWPIPTHH